MLAALTQSVGHRGLCGLRHPGFIPLPTVAPTITTTVPIRSAVLSMQFGAAAEAILAQAGALCSGRKRQRVTPARARGRYLASVAVPFSISRMMALSRSTGSPHIGSLASRSASCLPFSINARWRAFRTGGCYVAANAPDASKALYGRHNKKRDADMHGLDVDNQVLALRGLAKVPLAEMNEAMVHRALLMAADMIEMLGAEAAAAAWKEEQERRRASLLMSDEHPK
jgi:hypothetical protein